MDVKIELLPKGEFSITRENGQTLRGRFSMYALNRFCKSQKIENYLRLFSKLLTDMSLEEYAELVMIGLQDFQRDQPNQAPITALADMMDLIDEMGGLAGDNINNLVRHAIDRVGNVKEPEGEAAKVETPEQLEAKKKELSDNMSATPSGNEPLSQD